MDQPSASTSTASTSASVSSLLLNEILGFSPQLLLDDIINIANEIAITTVNGMEGFLERWAKERAATADQEGWDSAAEVEQGLVAFQTLLESHTDIAFDFLEVWSLRNIFAFPPELPIVAPHHEGLDLKTTPEQERELMVEIEELRMQLENQRRVRRLLTRAQRTAKSQLKRAIHDRDQLSFLSSQNLQALRSVPSKLPPLHSAVLKLPEREPAPAPPVLPAGQREWEAGVSGYQRWAAGAVMKRALKGGEDDLRRVEGIGGVEDMKEVIARQEAASSGLQRRAPASPDEDENIDVN